MFWLYEEWRGQSSVCAGDTDPLLPRLASIRQNEPENEEFVLYGDDKAIAGAGAGRGRAVVTLQSSRDCGPAPALQRSITGGWHEASFIIRPRLGSLHFWIIWHFKCSAWRNANMCLANLFMDEGVKAACSWLKTPSDNWQLWKCKGPFSIW